MPSSYTTNLGIEKPADGELDFIWGDVVNDNMDIVDRAVNGGVTLTLTGTSSTLTTTDGTLSDGQNKFLLLGGSPSSTHTITVSPNDAKKIYYVYNLSGQSVVFAQGSGTTVTIATGDTAIIYADGNGSGAGVINLADHLAMNSARITGGAITGVSVSSNAVTVTGGTINGTPVGNTAPSTGAFTTLNASGAAALSGSTTLSGTTQIANQLGLGGANYGTSGQVVTSNGPGVAPSWGPAIPTGVIVMWSGAIGAIPSGWALCNGSNGTPDLRDRFVVGAGSAYAVGATGGSDTVALTEANLPAHEHAFSGTTNTTGAHTHTINFTAQGDAFGGTPAMSVQAGGLTKTTSSNGAHSHTFSGTTSSVGSGTAHENRPPYYALAYIMKL